MDILIGLLTETGKTLVSTIFDVVPIVAIMFGFQFLVIRRRTAHLRKIVIGFVYVVLGLTLFLVGLEQALFPVGKSMAAQLTAPGFLGGGDRVLGWWDYPWVYVFAAAIGFSTTVAEPSLIAVSRRPR